jgi:hypothetical protein
VQQLGNLLQQLFVFVEQFFMLKAGQFLQTQIAWACCSVR